MLALFGNFANAEGTRVPYGENMVVVQDKETLGRMNIPISLPKTGNFTFDLDMSSVKPTLTKYNCLLFYRVTL